MASNLPATQKANFDSCATKIAKKCHKIFPRETYVTLFREFVSITLSNIEHCHTVKPPNSRRLGFAQTCPLFGGVRCWEVLSKYSNFELFQAMQAFSDEMGKEYRLYSEEEENF